MLEWLKLNIGTIVALLILVAVVALIIRKLVLDKRAGKSCCGDCGSCHACSCEFPKDIKISKP